MSSILCLLSPFSFSPFLRLYPLLFCGYRLLTADVVEWVCYCPNSLSSWRILHLTLTFLMKNFTLLFQGHLLSCNYVLNETSLYIKQSEDYPMTTSLRGEEVLIGTGECPRPISLDLNCLTCGPTRPHFSRLCCSDLGLWVLGSFMLVSGSPWWFIFLRIFSSECLTYLTSAYYPCCSYPHCWSWQFNVVVFYEWALRSSFLLLACVSWKWKHLYARLPVVCEMNIFQEGV